MALYLQAGNLKFEFINQPIMKTKIICLMFLLSAYSITSIAQDKKMDKAFLKLLSDTTFITAAEVSLAPGQKTDVHTHPAHFFYALTPCNLKVHFTDGKTESYELDAGGNGYSGPEGPHFTENAGKKTAKFLIIELKEHPYMQNGKANAK